MISPKACPKISLITPMFNEGVEIKNNIERILEVLDAWEEEWEYILVDDGSTDDSYNIAQDVLDSRHNCRVVHYPVNRGRGYALRKGFEAARGDYIITTESDLSWGADIITKLYSELISSGSDIVVASVFNGKDGFRNVPLSRRLISVWGNRIMRWCFESEITQFSGMTRGYRRESIQSLHLEEHDKEIHLEIISKAEALGFQITEIPAKISWSRGRSRGSLLGKLSILKYVGPHLLSSFNQGSLRILLSIAGLLFVLGSSLSVFGTLNKIYAITPDPMPNLINYGLVIILMSLVCTLFAGVSAQLGYMRRSLIHLQSQVSTLGRDRSEGLHDAKPRDDE